MTEHNEEQQTMDENTEEEKWTKEKVTEEFKGFLKDILLTVAAVFL